MLWLQLSSLASASVFLCFYSHGPFEQHCFVFWRQSFAVSPLRPKSPAPLHPIG